jgi:alpha-L-fucosidase
LDTAGFSRGLGAPPNDTLNQGNINGKNWLPAECDVSIRPGWFYHFKEDSLVKSPEKLFDIYLKSVGRGANLILNVPPDPSGLISSYDSAALMKFAQLRNESFQDLLNKDQSVIYLHGEKIKELSKGKDGVINLGKNFKDEFLEIRFNKELAVNCILLKELLQWGQRIKSFEIEVYDNDSLLYKNAYTTMGHQRIISFPTRNSNRILIRITGAKSDPILGELSVYHIPEMLVEK